MNDHPPLLTASEYGLPVDEEQYDETISYVRILSTHIHGNKLPVLPLRLSALFKSPSSCARLLRAWAVDSAITALVVKDKVVCPSAAWRLLALCAQHTVRLRTGQSEVTSAAADLFSSHFYTGGANGRGFAGVPKTAIVAFLQEVGSSLPAQLQAIDVHLRSAAASLPETRIMDWWPRGWARPATALSPIPEFDLVAVDDAVCVSSAAKIVAGVRLSAEGVSCCDTSHGDSVRNSCALPHAPTLCMVLIVIRLHLFLLVRLLVVAGAALHR